MKEEVLRLDNVITDDAAGENLHNFNLHLFAGEILGLIAIDEKGKDKLLELLQRNSPIKYGRIYFNEKLVNSYRYSDKAYNKIYIMAKPDKLINDLSVLDNVYVMRRGFKKHIISPGTLKGQFGQLMEELELDVPIHPYDAVMNLTEYERCIVEILKAVVERIQIIVVNNISSHLSDQDLKAFKQLIMRLSLRGFGIIYIGNHHEDVFPVSHRTALMKDGKIIKVFEKEELQGENILPYTIPMDEMIPFENAGTRRGKIVFREIYTDYLKNLSFEAGRGECVVLFDRSSKVQKDIIGCFTGERKLKGGILFSETEGRQKEIVQKEWRNRIGIIDENPIKKNLYYHLSFVDNLSLFLDSRPKKVCITSKIKDSIKREFYQEFKEAVYENDIRNLEKKDLYSLIYYKILLQKPDIVFIAQPFSNADMFLRFHIIELIRKLKHKGIVVVILAFTISDNLHVADKFILVEGGYKKSEYTPETFSDIMLDI